MASTRPTPAPGSRPARTPSASRTPCSTPTTSLRAASTGSRSAPAPSSPFFAPPRSAEPVAHEALDLRLVTHSLESASPLERVQEPLRHLQADEPAR